MGLALAPATAFRAASPASIQANEPVSVWLTTGDQSKLLARQADLSFAASSASAGTTITIDDATTYQTIDGFGAAMTGSAAYNFNQKLNASQRDALFNDLFTGSGIRLTFLRHSIGASDFSAYGDYTYDDRPSGQTDVNLTSFGLGSDLTDVVPMLKAARAKNNAIKILGSPWSAPAWMKETQNLRNGYYLSTAYYDAYARYFVKYVQAYAAQGVPIYAVTLQNEPGNTAAYMSMRMDPGNQAAFLKNNIGPAFQNAGLSTKLIAYDHNWDNKTPTISNYVQSVFADATAASYAAGSAWHGYSATSGIPNMTAVHNAYPNEDIWFTEITGSVGSSFAGDLKWHGAWQPGKHKPIVARETFARVQSLLGEKVYKANELLFGGELMTCGHCGRPVTGESVVKKQTGKRYVYYRCAGYTAPGHPRDRLREQDVD
ncbi:MAG: hypothetical protein EOO62_30755, partial [Hymenobacter sp.]